MCDNFVSFLIDSVLLTPLRFYDLCLQVFFVIAASSQAKTGISFFFKNTHIAFKSVSSRTNLPPGCQFRLSLYTCLYGLTRISSQSKEAQYF